MRKIIIGWILHVVITVAIFFFCCGMMGVFIGMAYGMSGNENTPTEEELASNVLFGIFCFASMLGANFFSYYITIKKCLKYTS